VAGLKGLLGQDEFIRLGDAQPILLSTMDDHDLPVPSEERCGVNAPRHDRAVDLKTPVKLLILVTSLSHTL